MTKREDILNQLRKYTALSTLELKLLNGPSTNVSARISELKKIGYNISLETIEEQKYVYHPGSPLVPFLEKNNLFDTVLSVNDISKSMKLSIKEVQDEIASIFSDYIIIQVSPDKVVIKKRRAK